MSESVSQAEYGRRRGWSRAYVNKLVKTGKLTLVDKRVDVELADAELAKNIDSTRSNNGLAVRESAAAVGSEAGLALMEAKRLHEEYKARLARLRYEEARGLLVEKSEVDREAYAIGRVVRDAMLAIPSRLRDILAAEDNAKEIHRILERDIGHALDELTKTERGE